MAKDMDVLIKTEDRTEVDNVTKLIKTMSESEQNKMLIFLQGVKFAEALNEQQVTEKCTETSKQEKEKKGGINMKKKEGKVINIRKDGTIQESMEGVIVPDLPEFKAFHEGLEKIRKLKEETA